MEQHLPTPLCSQYFYSQTQAHGQSRQEKGQGWEKERMNPRPERGLRLSPQTPSLGFHSSPACRSQDMGKGCLQPSPPPEHHPTNHLVLLFFMRHSFGKSIAVWVVDRWWSSKDKQEVPLPLPPKLLAQEGEADIHIIVRKCSESNECKVYANSGEETAKFSWGWGWKEEQNKAGHRGWHLNSPERMTRRNHVWTGIILKSVTNAKA